MEAGSRRGLGVGRGLLGCAAAAGILLILLCRQPRPASTPFTVTSEHPPTIPKKRILQLPQGCVGIEDASALVQPSVSPTPSASPAMGQPIEGLGGFCDPIYPPNRVAHAIVYDMSEPEDKWPLRNAQFLRVFKGLRDTGSKVPSHCEAARVCLSSTSSFLHCFPDCFPDPLCLVDSKCLASLCFGVF